MKKIYLLILILLPHYTTYIFTKPSSISQLNDSLYYYNRVELERDLLFLNQNLSYKENDDIIIIKRMANLNDNKSKIKLAYINFYNFLKNNASLNPIIFNNNQIESIRQLREVLENTKNKKTINIAGILLKTINTITRFNKNSQIENEDLELGLGIYYSYLLNHRKACYYLEKSSRKGSMKAIILLKILANNNVNEALFNLGKIYMYSNPQEALSYLNKISTSEDLQIKTLANAYISIINASLN